MKRCPFNCFVMYRCCSRFNGAHIEVWRCPECGTVVLTA